MGSIQSDTVNFHELKEGNENLNVDETFNALNFMSISDAQSNY